MDAVMAGSRGYSPFEALEVWRLAHELALKMYQETERFPAREHYGLARS